MNGSLNISECTARDLVAQWQILLWLLCVPKVEVLIFKQKESHMSGSLTWVCIVIIIEVEKNDEKQLFTPIIYLIL